MWTTRDGPVGGVTIVGMLMSQVAADPRWRAVADVQGGLVSRRQLIELGFTRAQAAANVDNGRWQRVHPGVYATFTGPIDASHQVWGALLYAGRGSAACCSTALWLFGVLDTMPEILHVAIPEARRVKSLANVRMHRRRALNRVETPVHPVATPPRIRVEESLLDECARLTEDELVGLILRATQRRRTTPARLEGALAARSFQPRRSLIRDVLADAEAGVASPLEAHYRRRVEAPHRLPVGARNLLDVSHQGRKRFRDVEYQRWGLIVELDGREAHPADEAFRDMRRDNDTALSGRVTLRFGWRDVVGEPCASAAQVGLALQQRGWPGCPRPCSATCPIPPPTIVG
jgi:hypothetical protein